MRTIGTQGTIRALLLSCGVVISACGGGGGGADAGTSQPSSIPPPAPAPARVVAQSDAEIAGLLYSDQRTPPGFYADTTVPATGYVSTTHLKNSDLPSTPGGTTPHELCTDDWNEALGWSETVAVNAATYADLVATDSNARYFEFGRVPRGQPGAYLRTRVYKCQYIDRSGVDLQAATGTGGRMNYRPLSANDLRMASEYFWLFTTFNNFGHVVLRSSAADGVSLGHTLYIASLTRAAQPGGCDRIDVIEWTHIANAQTGELQRSRNVLWSFGARQAGAAVEACTP